MDGWKPLTRTKHFLYEEPLARILFYIALWFDASDTKCGLDVP